MGHSGDRQLSDTVQLKQKKRPVLDIACIIFHIRTRGRTICVTGVPAENQRPGASHGQTLLNKVLSTTPRYELLFR